MDIMNFRVLFRYELKKIFSQKAYWLALIVMMLMLAANDITPVFLGTYRQRKEREQALSGTVIDDEILARIDIAEDKHEFGPIYDFLKYATGRTEPAGLTADDLYRIRRENNGHLMDEGLATEEEKSYWEFQDAANTAPFVYKYDGAYEAFFEVVYFMCFMVLILCGIGLSGIFADERIRGTDQIIFGTRLGRKQLFFVKLLAGMICGFVSAFFFVAEEAALLPFLYGTDGWDAMLQIHIPQCMMNITMGRAVLYMAVLVLISGVFLGIITMFFSQLTMNHTASMALMILVLFASMFNPVGNSRILKMLFDMMPGAFVGSWLFETYTTVNLFGVRMNIMQYTPVFWLLTSMLLIAAAAVLYRKYEVNAG